MSRIKVIGIAFVLAALAVVGLQAPPAEASDCEGCWSAGWGSVCYPYGSEKCFGGHSRVQGWLFQCTVDDWRGTGYRCEPGQ